MRLVKLQTKEGPIWINADLVQVVTTPYDDKKRVLIGYAGIFTLTDKIMVMHTPAEAAALLDSRLDVPDTEVPAYVTDSEIPRPD